MLLLSVCLFVCLHCAKCALLCDLEQAGNDDDDDDGKQDEEEGRKRGIKVN